ncbi:MAG TPA: hypothetical protein VFX21_13910 [Acidimicrobiia bacterium]|nr:hypothetical protein [Acidimicrobiia bacterium]
MRFWLASLPLLLIARSAGAEPRRVTVDTPVSAFAHPGAIAPYLFLNRCVGGCAITGATTNDAAAHWTTIPSPGSYVVHEFATATGETGTAADADWAAVVQCMKEVYSPYAITVSDAPPPPGTAFNEAIIAGQPTDVGLGFDILGISPLANDCSPQDNVLSFSFANHHGPDARALNICWTASQESAHAYGLDHEYEFSDGNSACSDPMTYRTDCGGQKFFRNKRAKCGEMAARKCRCNSSQNSHTQLISIFGAGVPITAAPHASVIFPTNNSAVTTGWVTHISAGSQRGVAKVELYFNDSRWMVQPGAKFGANGQLDPSTYTFIPPANVPDGIIDIQGKVYDDLGIGVATIPIRVTKGAPCTTDDQCAAHQHCDAGRCLFEAPVGELGDSCEYPQYCKSWTCLGDGDKTCTQECRTDEPTSCPEGLECFSASENGVDGFCFPPGGGCCSVGHERHAIWIHGGLALAVLGSLRRRRRR